MSRVGTIINLEDGGTYDLLIMGFPNGFPRGYVSFEIGDTPRRITGVQKVVQTFLLNLFTSTGSDPVRASAGGQFSGFVFGSNISADSGQLRSTMIQLISQAETQTKQILNSNSSDLASQLQSVSFLYANSQDDSITLGLSITTRAGQTTSIAIPFPQTDLAINEVGWVPQS